jgi:hypothetical protein
VLSFACFRRSFMPSLILLAMMSSSSAQQEQQTDKREIWDTNLLSKRPAGKSKPLPATSNDALVGITLWRFRPSQSSDDPQVRSLIHEEDRSSQWTPERIKADTPLHEGEMIRISIETARTGYLYVIDCEEYADGSKGEFYLIFPELRIRNGDNHVTAGKVIEIPASDDKPPYFKVRRGRADQSDELLTILISPKPLEQVRVANQRLHLSAEQVAKWNRDWKTSTYRLEATGEVGKPSTLAEKLAGSGDKILTQDDPVPQTMYFVEAKPGKPLLVEIPLSVSK